MTALFSLCLLATAGGAAAAPKPLTLDWWTGHWEHLNSFQPYLESPTQTHNRQWDNKEWDPAAWAARTEGGGRGVIDGFYRADIVRRQYTENDMPAVEVGPAFYMLGGEDKQKVAAMIDYVYGVTRRDRYGTIMLYDWNTKQPIGAYTQHGLQLK